MDPEQVLFYLASILTIAGLALLVGDTLIQSYFHHKGEMLDKMLQTAKGDE